MQFRVPSGPFSLSLKHFSYSPTRTMSYDTTHSFCPRTSTKLCRQLSRTGNLPRNNVVGQIGELCARGLTRRDVAVPGQAQFLLQERLWVLDTVKLGFPLVQGRPRDRRALSITCKVKLDSDQDVEKEKNPSLGDDEEGGQMARVAGQGACWVVTVVYVGWLFLLPYAPGEPVWAITPATIQMLTDLSLNFFFILPFASMLANAVLRNGFSLESQTVPGGQRMKIWTFCRRAAGFHGLTAPVLHPTAEALFNFVIGWTLLFAPLLFTDKRRDRFGGSLETLWIIQMFLTNTVLAPYMAIRQNSSAAVKEAAASEQNILLSLRNVSRGMASRADAVGVAGALVGIVSLLWAFIGRPDAEFGGLVERWEYFVNYLGSERLAYAFMWDIALYSVFQPWLIGDNLENVTLERRQTVQILRFVPFVGLLAYVFGLRQEKGLER